jgi:hypothetical protein
LYCETGDHALLEVAWVELLVAQAIILGRQDAIELFYQSEKFMPVFLDRDKGTQFLNAITISFVHSRNRQQLKHLSRIQYVRRRTTGGGVE